MNRFFVCLALIAASVALNVYQWRTGGRATNAVRTAPAEAAEPGVRAADGADRPRSGQPAAGNGGMPSLQAATCPAQLARVTGEMTALQRKLDERLTMDEIFERSPPSPASEELVREYLEKAFAGAPKGYAYTAECRGEVCNVDVTAPEKGEWDWNEHIQADAYHHISAGYMMRGGTPGQDPVTKEAIMVSRTQVKLRDMSVADGIAILGELYERFATSDGRNRCTAGDPTRGYLVLQLKLDNEAHRITYDAGGTLPATPLGRCLLTALDAAIAATAIPDQVRSSVLYQTLEI